MKTYELWLLMGGRKSTCPLCSGMLVKGIRFFNCIDCGKSFEIKGSGSSDNSVVVKKI